MFLQSLHLENVRSLADVEFNFCQPDGSTRKWALLLGENGCGKSSVLRAAGLLLAGTEALPELIGLPRAWVRNGTKMCRVSARLVTQKNETRDVSLSFGSHDDIATVLKRNAKSLEPLTAALKHSTSNYPTIGYGASRRQSSGRLRNREQSGYFHTPRANAIATLFAADASLNALESWAMELDYSRGGAGLRIVEDTLAELLPGLTFHKIDRRAGSLLFRTPDGLVPLQQLSDGYQNMASWCGDLLYRLVSTFGHLKRPLASRGLLLVDEIDLHLHPVWQRQLRNFLSDKFPHLQIIATTHSPLTAQQAGEGEIFVLQRDPDGRVNVAHLDGTANLLTTQQIITSPAFGLETTLSKKMQEAEKDWKIGRKPEAKAKLEEMKRPTLVPPDSKTTALLEKIEQELAQKRSPDHFSGPAESATDTKVTDTLKARKLAKAKKKSAK